MKTFDEDFYDFEEQTASVENQTTNVITINHNTVQIKECKGQRVVTFKDIDMVHQRPEGTASRNFRENKKHFIENQDFFYLSGEALRIIKQTTNFVGSNAKELILLTESGYLMLVKSFQDDLAWEVQRELVNSYFRVKNIVPQDSYLMADPIKRAERWIQEEKIRQQLATQNQIMAPKANYYDGLVDSGHLTGIRETAKELGMKQNKFIAWLIDNHFMYRDRSKKLKVRSEYVDKYFEVKDKTNINGWSETQAFINVEGKNYFRKRLIKENLIMA